MINITFCCLLFFSRKYCIKLLNGLNVILQRSSMNKRDISYQTRKRIFAEDSIIACSIYLFSDNFKIIKSRRKKFHVPLSIQFLIGSVPKYFLVTSKGQKMIPRGIVLIKTNISYHFFVVDGIK